MFNFRVKGKLNQNMTKSKEGNHNPVQYTLRFQSDHHRKYFIK